MRTYQVGCKTKIGLGIELIRGVESFQKFDYPVKINIYFTKQLIQLDQNLNTNLIYEIDLNRKKIYFSLMKRKNNNKAFTCFIRQHLAVFKFNFV